MSKDLVVVLRSIGISLGLCSVVGIVESSDLTISLVLAIIGVVLVALTLGENNE